MKKFYGIKENMIYGDIFYTKKINNNPDCKNILYRIIRMVDLHIKDKITCTMVYLGLNKNKIIFNGLLTISKLFIFRIFRNVAPLQLTLTIRMSHFSLYMYISTCPGSFYTSNTSPKAFLETLTALPPFSSRR